MITNGFAAIYIRLYYTGADGKEQELSERIDRMSYCYDEEDDDLLDITLQSSDRNFPDHPALQEGAALRVIWGYIKSKDSGVRKIWVRDVKPEFTKEYVQVTLVCTEKGTDLKSSTSRKVYKNSTLLHVAADKAQKHGLKAKVEMPSTSTRIILKAKPGESLQSLLERESRLNWEANQKKLQDEYRKNPGKVRTEFQATVNEAWKKNRETFAGSKYREELAKAWYTGNLVTPLSHEDVNKMAKEMQQYDSFPQAGRSDKQTMNDMGRREQGGPFIVETRDDELIIKKRDFTQTPYRSYEYGGPTGELFEFAPETKTLNRKGAGSGLGFSGWNPLDKSFFSGVAGNHGDPTLAGLHKQLDDYEEWEREGKGEATAFFRPTLPFNRKSADGRDLNYRNSTALWNTAVPIKVSEHVAALKATIKDLEAKTKGMYNPLGTNPIDAYSQAANLKDASELQRNPATASVWGDPALKVGMIITILNVSKKYSGNYYIIKATHTMDRSSGYITELEMVRQGSNARSSEKEVYSKSLNKYVNKQIGDNKRADNRKNLKTKHNGPSKRKDN